MTAQIHPSAFVSDQASIGEETKIWHYAQVRERAKVGRGCILGYGVYIDVDVTVGDHCKVQNHALIYRGVELKNGVFIGPSVTFTNDLFPRAVHVDMSPKMPADWEVKKTLVHEGASIGANSTILCGIEIGAWAMVGAGSVVTKNVPSYGLVYGNPAKLKRVISPCASKMKSGFGHKR